MPSEYPIRIRMVDGLSPNKDIRVEGTGHMSSLLDARPTPHGLTLPHAPSNPISTPDTTISWPYPQLLKLEGENLLLFEQAIYSVNESTWAGSALSKTDTSTGEAGTIAASGGIWQGVSMNDAWFIANNTNFLFFGPDGTRHLSVNSWPKVVGHLDDRLILGAMSGTFISSSRFTTLFSHWKKVVSKGRMPTESFESTWLVMGAPRGGDPLYPNMLMFIILGMFGDAKFDALLEAIYTAVEMESITFIPVPINPNSSSIMAVKQLGNRLAVYTDRGIFIINPETHFVDEHVDVQIAGRGALIGDNRKHTFIAADGSMWETVQNAGFSKVGYEEHLSTLTEANILLSHDAQEDDLYISDGSNTYVRSRGQLFKSSYKPTSLHRYGANLYGITEGGVTTFSFTTKPLNLGYRGLTSITWIEVQCAGIVGLKMALDFRYGQNDSWITGEWVYGSPEGRFYMGISANEFRIRGTGTMSSGDKLEELLVRVQYADDSTVRGPRGTGLGSLQASEGNS